MQNHGGYDTDSSGDFTNTVSLNYEVEYPLAETYLSEVNVTDAALKKLIDYFEDSNENTMIVMFGDHLPAINSMKSCLEKNQLECPITIEIIPIAFKISIKESLFLSTLPSLPSYFCMSDIKFTLSNILLYCNI